MKGRTDAIQTVTCNSVVFLCAAVLLASSMVTTASAADQTVTLINLSMDGAAAREIAHDIARAVRKNKDLRYHSVNHSLNIGGEDIHRSNLRSGKSLWRSAKSRLRDGDYEEAAEELESAVTNYLESFPFTEDHVHVANVMVMHGVALFLAKQKKAARKAWTLASEFRPKHQADLSAHGPKVQAAYKSARQGVLSRPKVTYEIVTKPAHAEVWCNGRYFGLSPAYVKTYSGRQFVAVRKHGVARAGRVKTIKRSDSDGVSFTLARARKTDVYDNLRESLGEVFDGAVERNDLSAARGLLNAGSAIIMRASGTREQMTIQLALANLDGRQIVKRMTKKMPWLRRNKAAMVDLVKELFKAPDIPKGADGPVVKKETVLTKWWFWTGAAVVVGGSVAAYMLLSGDETLDQKYKAGTGGLAIQF